MSATRVKRAMQLALDDLDDQDGSQRARCLRGARSALAAVLDAKASGAQIDMIVFASLMQALGMRALDRAVHASLAGNRTVDAVLLRGGPRVSVSLPIADVSPRVRRFITWSGAVFHDVMDRTRYYYRVSEQREREEERRERRPPPPKPPPHHPGRCLHVAR